MKNLLSLLSVMFLLQSCLMANPIHKPARAYGWIMGVNPFISTKIDSTISSYPFLLCPSHEAIASIGFTIPFCGITKKQAKVEVRIKYKTENCNNLRFKLSTIGECGKVNTTDTFRLPPSNEWTVFRQSVDVMHPVLLGLAFEVKGERMPKEENSQENPFSMSYMKKVAEYSKIWIDSLDVLIDGRYVDELSLPDNNTAASITKSDIIPVQRNDYSSLPFFNKKILAIGESVHGTETMNDIAIEIIKDRIEHKNCRLVLLEMSLTLSFHINRYLEGDPRFKLDSISSYIDNVVIPSPSFLSLLQWIKEYNLHSNEKVHFSGMDWNIFQSQSYSDLFNFFYTLNEGKNSKELKKMCTSFLLPANDFPLKTALSVFDSNHGFGDILSKKEMEIMRRSLIMEDGKVTDKERFIRRDSIMYENANFLMKTLLKEGETVTAYCHLGHANYMNNYGWLEPGLLLFGEYMKNFYKDDYSCVGLVAEEGRYFTQVLPGRMGIGQLHPSPLVSLEYCMNHWGVSPCYLSFKKLTDRDVLKMRRIGNSKVNIGEFQWFFPECMMDGAIFTKNVVAIPKSKDIFKRNLGYHVRGLMSLMYAYEKKRKMDLDK